MREKVISPECVSREYAAGLKFNEGIELYSNVKTNEDFFIGKQWENVKSNGLPTPVFNFLKRVVLFSVANISTENLKLNAKPMSCTAQANTEALELFSNILNDQFAAIFEQNRLGGLIREFCRNAAVDGDGCMYVWWDESAETGQPSKGVIRTEVLQNTQVMFGNPNSRDVQSQPYILVERRMLVREAKEYAKAHGASAEDISAIVPDSKESGNIEIDQLGGEKVTVILRMWRDKESGNIHCYECTRAAEVRAEWDIGISLYPIVWMNWDYIQDCYHGQAMISGLIPNQIFVNKLFAMSMISLMSSAYPKVVYDKTKVPKWSAKVGAALGVNGSVEGVAKIIDPAQISPQIYQFIETAISYTQKFLGASDVALGDTRPDNTSAIIALQRAAATPMELTKQNLLQNVETLGRIYIAFMAEYYGERVVEIDVPAEMGGGKAVVRIDFEMLKKIPCGIDLDAGASAYWSEIANMQTLDNLLMQGKIPTSEYLRRLPNGQISDREKLITIVEAAERGQIMAAAPSDIPGAPVEQEAPLRGGAGYGALQRIINQTGEVPKEA
jgi:hypothetical protein